MASDQSKGSIERKHKALILFSGGFMSSRDSAMNTYGIQQCGICSFDESGFRIVVEKDQEVVACTSDHQSQLPLHSDTNQETVTIVESTSGDYVSPPMTIVPGVLHQERRSTTTNIGGETLISVLDPGNFNDVLCPERTKHPKRPTKTRQHGKWRLLLHSTVTAQRGSLISAMITIPFHLHTIHLLQPLDSVCFNLTRIFVRKQLMKQHGLAVQTSTNSNSSQD